MKKRHYNNNLNFLVVLAIIQYNHPDDGKMLQLLENVYYKCPPHLKDALVQVIGAENPRQVLLRFLNGV